MKLKFETLFTKIDDLFEESKSDVILPTKTNARWKDSPFVGKSGAMKTKKDKQKGKKGRQESKQDLKKGRYEEGYQILPSMDRERYTEIKGLEGPFQLHSGKIVYYDPKEGKYYDRDSDMYMDYDEYEKHSQPSNIIKKEARTFKGAFDILSEGGRCDGQTKKASSTSKGKKWMQCVKNPDGKGYKRVHWGQKGVKVTGKSGDTKRKKSFRARHKCSSAKAGTARKMACSDW